MRGRTLNVRGLSELSEPPGQGMDKPKDKDGGIGPLKGPYPPCPAESPNRENAEPALPESTENFGWKEHCMRTYGKVVTFDEVLGGRQWI